MHEQFPYEQYEIDPASLYHLNGHVNLEAVEAFLATQLTAAEQSSPPDNSVFNELIVESIALQEDESITKQEIQRMATEEPTKLAIMYYIGHMMKKSAMLEVLPRNSLLEDDPTHVPDLAHELQRFATFYQEYQPANYTRLQSYCDIMGNSKNDVDTLRCIVAVPVAGHQEYDNIFRTLEQFAAQDLPTDQFEIVLNVNVPHNKGKDIRTTFSPATKTISEIERFKDTYPDVAVRYFGVVYDGESSNIGSIRADLWDTISCDLQQRGRAEDVLVISADADVVELTKNYLSGMMEVWRDTEVDIVTSGIKWQPVPGIAENGFANRVLRHYDALQLIHDNYSSMLLTPDACTGISLASYLAVGGFDRTKKLGEMIELVKAIRQVRMTPAERARHTTTRRAGLLYAYTPACPVEAKSEHSILTTDSRRIMAAMALGHSPDRAWDQSVIAFGNNETLRTAPQDSVLVETMAQKYWKRWIIHMNRLWLEEVPVGEQYAALSDSLQKNGLKGIRAIR